MGAPLARGSAPCSNVDGEAELTLAACWPGTRYSARHQQVFTTTGYQTGELTKSSLNGNEDQEAIEGRFNDRLDEQTNDILRQHTGSSEDREKRELERTVTPPPSSAAATARGGAGISQT